MERHSQPSIKNESDALTPAPYILWIGESPMALKQLLGSNLQHTTADDLYSTLQQSAPPTLVLITQALDDHRQRDLIDLLSSANIPFLLNASGASAHIEQALQQLNINIAQQSEAITELMRFFLTEIHNVLKEFSLTDEQEDRLLQVIDICMARMVQLFTQLYESETALKQALSHTEHNL